MTDQQPEALRLADALDGASNGPMDFKHKAAAELRRLHAEKALLENIKELQAAQIVQLLEALEKLSLYVAHNGDDWVQREARAAIAAVKEMK